MLEWAPHDCTTRSSHLPFEILASSRFSASFDDFKAFDGGIANGNTWISAAAPPQWLRIKLATGDKRILASYDVQVNNLPDPNRAPKDWTMEGSNDGSSWDTLDTVTNQTGWGSGETRSFTCDVATTAYSYFRLNISANNGDGLVQVGELYLYSDAVTWATEFGPHNMTTNTAPSPLVAADSTHFSSLEGWKAFDGSVTYPNGRYLGQGGGADWVSIDRGSGNVGQVFAYTVRLTDSNELTRAPKDWKLQGSNNGSSWTDLDTQTSQTGWYSTESRTFYVGNTTDYRYFRLNITANNGDGTYTEVGEICLWGAAAAIVSVGALGKRANQILAGGIYAS